MVKAEILMKGADNAVSQCMNIKQNERVLILTDKNMPLEISESIRIACLKKRAKPDAVFMKPLKQDAEEPEKDIAKMMRECDVFFLITSKSLSHTKARRDASKSGVRGASLPHVPIESFTLGGLTADYNIVKKNCERMNKAVRKVQKIKITSDNGTDLSLNVGDYEWDMDTGIFHKPGDFGNLPAGETETAPNFGQSNGILIVDKWGRYGENIEVAIEDGIAISINGSKQLERDVIAVGRLGRNIAEIGIGCNPKARLMGNVLEDEKIFGTVHIALGNNMSYGGNVDVPLHLDGIIIKPTLEANGKLLIRDGKWMI